MTRTELYTLVWSKPMIHLAREFGLSDVGLRKICVKHSIPTPPLGYWAKLAHGKPVEQTPLPPLNDGTPESFYLVPRPSRELPPHLLPIHAAAVEYQAAPENAIIVLDERPEKLHRIAAAVEKALRKAKPDGNGFLNVDGKELPEVMVGPESAQRLVRILDAFVKATAARGFRLVGADEGFRIIVDDELFALRLYGGKDRKPHEPTAAELKAQARRDEWRDRYSSLYSSDTKAWRTWDYFPSGRLSMQLTDPTHYPWNNENLVGRWHDRPNKKLEEYLGDAMVALVTASALVKHRRAEEEQKARLREEEAKRRRREEARIERARKRREFLARKADEFAEFQRMIAFADFLNARAGPFSDEPVYRISRELGALVADMRLRLDRDALNEEISRLELFGEDDPV